MKRAQAWSMDIMIAIVIFIGTIFVFYSILSTKQGDKTKELQDDAITVLKNVNITQNVSQIKELLQEEYSVLKRKLRIENEFCIFLEDEDGNLIYIDQATGIGGVGSKDILLDENPCTEIT